MAIEGPYGAFTHHARSSDRVVLIGAGVGITPLRALLEDLPSSIDVTVVVRASTTDELVHRDEVAALVEQRGGQFHQVIGSRHKVRFDAGSLRRLVPELSSCDVYICGPDGFSKSMVAAAVKLGVPRSRIHEEAFAF